MSGKNNSWGENNNRVEKDVNWRRQLEHNHEDEQNALHAAERERKEVERWENIKKDLNRYWQMHEAGSQAEMDTIISDFKTRYNYGLNFTNMILGDLKKDDEITKTIDEIDSDGDPYEDSHVIEEYHGTVLWECHFCKDHTTSDDILDERMLGNWIVPMCNLCINRDNRPCSTCFERVCECEYRCGDDN